MSEIPNKIIKYFEREDVRKKYEDKWAPRIKKYGGKVGEWFVEGHKPEYYQGDYCPWCAVGKKGPDCLSERRLVATSKPGQAFESWANRIIDNKIKNFWQRRPLSKR
jgi:hypothetical protein